MFHPPRCPHRHCRNHADPAPRFYLRHGSFRAACRPHAVPRFRCKACRRTFSRQTFRMDYRDHRPYLNPRLFWLLASGLGLRQSARALRLTRRCSELKARKIGRHLRRLNLNLRHTLPADAQLQFVEFETYEGRRNTRPLSVPVLIETNSRFIVWAESAPIRPSGRMTPARLAAIAEDEQRLGRRKDISQSRVLRTLKRGAELVGARRSLVVDSDEKTSYPSLLRRAFARVGVVDHRQTSSRIVRDTWNPLFPINQTEAKARDLMGRMRRKSWLVSKRYRYLDIALHVFVAYRNYVRRRFNRDKTSAAAMLGFVPRRMTAGELLSWRQDGGRAVSIHPLASRAESVARWRAGRALAS